MIYKTQTSEAFQYISWHLSDKILLVCNAIWCLLRRDNLVFVNFNETNLNLYCGISVNGHYVCISIYDDNIAWPNNNTNTHIKHIM